MSMVMANMTNPFEASFMTQETASRRDYGKS